MKKDKRDITRQKGASEAVYKDAKSCIMLKKGECIIGWLNRLLKKEKSG